MTQVTVSRPLAAKPAFPAIRVLNLLALARQRRRLAGLDDRALEDIGVTRAQANAEANRPFWDAPDTWLNTPS